VLADEDAAAEHFYPDFSVHLGTDYAPGLVGAVADLYQDLAVYLGNL
jgi:hypothetical protein